MDATEKKAFRKSFMGGFSKEDVNRYIEEITSRHNEVLAECEARFRESERVRLENAAKLSQAEQELAVLRKRNEEYSALILKNDELHKSYELLATKYKELEAESAVKDEKLASLSEKAERLEHIDAEYTACKAGLADIEISARARASETLSAAENEASEMRRALAEEIETTRNQFERERAAALRETSELFANVARTMDALKLEADSLDARISRVCDAARINVSNLCVAVAGAQDKVRDINAQLSEEE